MVMVKCWCKENARELCLGCREGLSYWTERREQSYSAAALFNPHWQRRAAAFHFPEWVPVTPTPQKAAPLRKEKENNSRIITSSLLQYPNRLLPSSPVRTNENVSLQKEKPERQDTHQPHYRSQTCTPNKSPVFLHFPCTPLRALPNLLLQQLLYLISLI